MPCSTLRGLRNFPIGVAGAPVRSVMCPHEIRYVVGIFDLRFRAMVLALRTQSSGKLCDPELESERL